MPKKEGLTYKGAGVNYRGLDDFKKRAQASASQTDKNAERFGISVYDWTRGESVFVVNFAGHRIGFTIEGLGTKNLAEEHFRQALAIHEGTYVGSQESFADRYAQCAVAMIVNDQITLGVFPAVLGMHPAVASDTWFNDKKRSAALVEGWKDACDLAGAVWGPGETPALKDIIVPDTMCLSGAGWGVAPYRLLNPDSIQHGDAISFLTSSGVHANGYTLARKIAGSLRNGYRTKLSNGQMYGEALLEPTHIYVKFIEACLKTGIDIRYGVNITGHGWRKLMRGPGNFQYRVNEVPRPHPVFGFMQKRGGVSDREAYGNLNMGAGFAIYSSPGSVPLMREIWEEGDYPFKFLGGAGEIRASKSKSVYIKPKGIRFREKELDLR